MPQELVRFGDTALVKRKLAECKSVGIKVQENKISAIISAEYDGNVVLSCQKKGPDNWLMKFSRNFWGEHEKSDYYKEEAATA
jgi:hypothetical protein